MKINNGNGKSQPRAKAREKETFEKEVRRSRVIGLHSRCLTQMEIAKELNVDQSTISKDLRYIKDEAKNKIIEFTNNLSFEFVKCLAEIGEIKRELWKIASTEIDPPLNNNNVMIDPNIIITTNMNNKNRIAALTQLLETIKHRMELITGGPRSTHDHIGMTVMGHANSVKESMKTDKDREQDRIEELRRIAALSGI
jgi:orotate phosphoribosyltransferase-like protein